MYRAYLVSQGAHLAGMPEDGVRDVLSAARCWELIPIRDLK
jgi:hypothetical protein